MYVYARKGSNHACVCVNIVKLMGYKRSPPPFLSLLAEKRKYFFKRNVLGGVNFASGGSGILRKTGKKFVSNFIRTLNL